MRLEGKTTLVTGGGSGIGRSICELFAREGSRVVCVDLREERARETVEGFVDNGHALALSADVSQAESVRAMTEQALDAMGTVDILVNNAAIAVGDDILSIDEDVWNLNLNVVLGSVYLCSRALLPQMLERGSGVVVNISSVNGLTGLGEEGYSAAKAGVLNLTRNMAIKYAQRGVRVNAICPGTVRTPIWNDIVREDPQVFERLEKWYPLGRVGEPEDISRAALFLASDDASWITGEVLNVDGGLMSGLFAMSQDLNLELFNKERKD
ncbi:MAG: glucose 1-dehydrogenase [Candidatus Latescibacterota bacterium]|nr:glucose 1-dehydrogenase [Candidatus Latescibacterota bacterium]